jgi:membrane protein required for colicin V production
MGWVDVALLSVLGLSVAVGLLRGLLAEVLSLAGWLVAYYVAHLYAADFASHVPVGAPGSQLNVGAAMGVLFVIVLVLWGVMSWLVSKLIRASILSGADRLLGGVFGLARGVVIGLVVATVVNMTPLSHEPAWQVSQGAAWLQVVIDGLRPLLPNSVNHYLPAAASRGAIEMG